MEDVFRRKFGPLTPRAKVNIDAIKAAAEGLYAVIDRSYAEARAAEEPSDPRHQAIARTNLEATVMFAVKGLTT